jgi:hypothetical protein
MLKGLKQMSFEIRANSRMPQFKVYPAWGPDELEDARDHVVERIAVNEKQERDIVGQLERSAWLFETAGQLINADWWSRATCALHHVRRNLKHLRVCLEEIDQKLGKEPVE